VRGDHFSGCCAEESVSEDEWRAGEDLGSSHARVLRPAPGGHAELLSNVFIPAVSRTSERSLALIQGSDIVPLGWRMN